MSLAILLLAGVVAAPFLLATEDDSALAPSLFASRILSYGTNSSLFPSLTVHGYSATLALGTLPELDPARDALLIVSPTAGFAHEEVRTLRAFLEAGGHALVADNGGVGGDLLQRLGAGITMSTTSVYSPSFDGNPRRVLTTNAGVVPGLADEVPMTRPALIQGGTPLLLAPHLSWLDVNDNNQPDLGEPLVSGATAASTPVGRGILIVVGDPDLLTKSEPQAARAFIDLLAKDRARIVVDEGHRGFSDPLGVHELMAGRVGVVAATGILITALGVGALAVLGPRFSREQPPPRARAIGRGHDPRLVAETIGELERT